PPDRPPPETPESPQSCRAPPPLRRPGRPGPDSSGGRPRPTALPAAVDEGPFAMMTDPIADMLTRIRNSVRIERPLLDMPASNMRRGIAQVLKDEGYIW